MTSTADALVRKRERDEGIGTNQNAIKFGGQDYSSLKSQCLKEGVLFRDHRFPASQRSLGHDKLGPYSPDTLGLVWKRPKELYDNPRFIDDGATRTDICQGILGDCWLLASIASLTLNKQILARVVPQGQNFDKDYAGIFHFQIWQFGEWVDVVVDDRLPTRDGELLFVCSAEGSEFWSALLEKAYAKVNGSYEALIGGTTTESAVNFTGGIAEMYILDKAPPKLFRIIQKALRLGSLLGCSTDSDVNESKQLKGEHAYSLTGAQEVHVRGRTVQLVRIRNPWGHAEWTGAWSDGSKEWGHIPAEEKAKLHHSAEDGEFWMSFVDLKKNFHVLEICNLTPDALTSDEVQQWNCYQFKGTWKVGSTAGGCLNYPDTFFSNPQYAIKLEEVDDDPEDEGGCSFLVGLMQKDCRKDQNSGRKLESIGFAIYKMPDEYKGRTNIRLGSDVLSGQCVAMTPAFTKAREVCERFCLPPGEYVIIPSTFEPNKNGTFLLRVFTEKQATTSNMEEDISAEVEEPEISDEDMDPHFKILFMHNAENDSEVSVFELVQVLNSALSQRADIKTDGFSLETCRHMVNLLDKDGSAKLGLIEFNGLWMKIQKYLKIFKRHDKDNSGTMSSHEMRGALSKAGFQINSDVLQVIVSRYADASYAIDFDCFVSCLIRLEMLFKMFKTLIRADCGMIELDLLQWLCLGII